MQPPTVEPPHPPHRRRLHLLPRAPTRRPGVDQLALEQADRALHQRIVIRRAHPTDRTVHAMIEQLLAERQTRILTAGIRMMNHAVSNEPPIGSTPDAHSLLQSPHHQLAALTGTDRETQDAPREAVLQERHVHPPFTSEHVREVRHPNDVGRILEPVSPHQIRRADAARRWDGRADLPSSCHALQARDSHQARHLVTPNVDTLVLEGVPYLTDAVHTKVLAVHPMNDLQETLIGLLASGCLPLLGCVVRARGDRHVVVP